MLEKAGLNTTRVTFVVVDFLKEDWLEKLVNAGFKSRARGRWQATEIRYREYATGEEACCCIARVLWAVDGRATQLRAGDRPEARYRRLGYRDHVVCGESQGSPTRPRRCAKCDAECANPRTQQTRFARSRSQHVREKTKTSRSSIRQNVDAIFEQVQPHLMSRRVDDDMARVGINN